MDNLITAANDAENMSVSFVTRIKRFENQVAERETQARERAAKYGQLGSEQDSSVRQVVKQATLDQAKREARAYRRDLADGTEAERTKRLKELLAIEAKANTLAPLYESPVQMLSRMGLGSAERSRYSEQLRGAGPRELKNYADWARYKGDRILAAAVLSRLDTLPSKNRPFKAVEFAMAIVGEEFELTKKAIGRIRVATQRAVNVNRDFERGRVNTTAKISMGLARRAV